MMMRLFGSLKEDDRRRYVAIEAAKLGLIAPILVGPLARIRDAAEQAEADVSSFPIEASAHSHDSAAKAVELVRQGKADALMKGSSHTDELMGAVVARDRDPHRAAYQPLFHHGCSRP